MLDLRRTDLGGPKRFASVGVAAKHVDRPGPFDHRAEPFGMLHLGRPDEKAATRIPIEPERPSRSETARHEQTRRGGEVLERVMLVAQHPGAMPRLSVLTAAANGRYCERSPWPSQAAPSVDHSGR